MRATPRALLLLFLLGLSAGCKTTGGKVFGTAGVASAIGSGYLLATSSTTIEDGRLVTHEDRQHAGAGLLFAAVIAAGGWAISELMFGEPAPAEELVPSPPAVIVVQERHTHEREWLSPGWRFDPGDRTHKLHAPGGALIGHIDREGHVRDGGGAYLGRVDMRPSCGVACKRRQARAMLRGLR